MHTVHHSFIAIAIAIDCTGFLSTIGLTVQVSYLGLTPHYYHFRGALGIREEGAELSRQILTGREKSSFSLEGVYCMGVIMAHTVSHR